MIRLQRRGKKHQAAYRVVVGEKRSKLLGEQTDDLGWYDPHANKLEVNKEKVLHWLSKGAKLSDTLNNLLVGAGLVAGKKIAKHKQVKKSGETRPAAAEAPKAQ